VLAIDKNGSLWLITPHIPILSSSSHPNMKLARVVGTDWNSVSDFATSSSSLRLAVITDGNVKVVNWFKNCDIEAKSTSLGISIPISGCSSGVIVSHNVQSKDFEVFPDSGRLTQIPEERILSQGALSSDSLSFSKC